MLNLSLLDISMQSQQPINHSATRTLSSEQLFGAAKQVYIEHNGEIYTLKITKNGKLLLVK